MDVISHAEEAVLDAVSMAEVIVLDAVSSAEDLVSDAVANAEGVIMGATGARTIWPAAACLLAAVSCILFTWRVWSFTIRPWLHPREPKELPYWIPCHAFNFFYNPNELITHGQGYFDDDSPFAISFLGRKYYIIVSTQDIPAMYGNSTTLSWNGYFEDLINSFRVKHSSLGDMRRETRSEKSNRDPTETKSRSLGVLTEGLYRRHYFHGSNLDRFSDRTMTFVDISLRWQTRRARYTVNQDSVSLLGFCANVMVDATTRAMFGDDVFTIEPRLTQIMTEFTEEAWKLLIFPYPKFAARQLHTTKEGLHHALLKYVQRRHNSSTKERGSIVSMLDELKAADIGESDTASVAFFFLWALNMNAYRLSFWMLSYLLFDEGLRSTIRAETFPAFAENRINHNHLFKECPRLMAIYNEVLRLAFGAVSIRRVVAPAEIGGKKLCTGSSVMVPIRQLHYDEETFGSNAGEFDSRRFLHNELDQSPSFVPFGESEDAFPQPFLAKREILIFVAILINRYDIELVDGSLGKRGSPTLPDIDYTCPTLGIMPPVKGTEVYIRLKEAA